MIVIALVSVLLGLISSEAYIIQDVAPEEKINEAIANINKYILDNKYQNLQFKDYEAERLSMSMLQLGDLSTIQIKPQTPVSILTTVSNTGRTYSYNATLQLQNGFVQYDFLMKLPVVSSRSGTVLATAKHSFQVEGTVNIDSVRNCKADLSKIDVKIGHLKVSIKPSGVFEILMKPYIQYFTNTYVHEFLPLETSIADYIENSIPKSKFSELVCDAFNK